MIKKEYIFLDSEIKDINQAMDFIAGKAVEFDLASDKSGLVDDLFSREKEFSTNLGMGISIPHTKSKYMLKPALMFIRYKEPIPWGDEDNVLGSMVFLTPKDHDGNLHLKMLSNVSRKLVHEDFRKMLLKDGDKEEIYKGLTDALRDVNKEENNG